MGSPVTETTRVRLTLPRLGETMEEARVTGWLKAPGETFKRGDVLLEVETDKTVVEVPALQDGTLVAQLVTAGEMVALDQPIADIDVAGGTTTVTHPPSAPDATPMQATPARDMAAARPPVAPLNMGDRPAASPLARRLARQANLRLETLAGTGRRGRITAGDVLGAAHPDSPLTQTRFGAVALRHLAGSRTAILLLHGLHDEGRGWRDLPDRLARAGHRVLVPDLPGHGASTATTIDLTEATEALAEALDQALPQGPVRLVGHSLGAILATRLAARLGPRAEHLILLAPAGLGPSLNPDFLDLMDKADTPAALDRALWMLGTGPVSDTVMRGELARLAGQRPRTAALARSLAQDGIQQIDIAPDLARLSVPITAVFGTADRIIDWHDCAALPAAAAIHLVAGAGHLPHAAAPDLILALLTGLRVPHLAGAPVGAVPRLAACQIGN